MIFVQGNYNFSKIYSAGINTCGILQNGTALCWGANQAGQIGDNTIIDIADNLTIENEIAIGQIA